MLFGFLLTIYSQQSLRYLQKMLTDTVDEMKNRVVALRTRGNSKEDYGNVDNDIFGRTSPERIYLLSDLHLLLSRKASVIDCSTSSATIRFPSVRTQS